MKNEEKAKMIAEQCRPCSDDFYSGIYQGVLLALNSEQQNKLEIAIDLQLLAYSRAKEILEISDGYAYLYNPVGVAFDHDNVDVRFENTLSDYPDFEFVTLSLEELKMTDEKWYKHIDELKEARAEKERKRLELIKQSELERKKKQYLALKDELGY